MYSSIKETDAKKMFCPMSLSSSRAALKCFGSKCMAWRATLSDKDWDGGYCGMAGRLERDLKESDPY